MRTCLVVDDSRVVRKVARRILESHGFMVEEAEDGQVALDACRRSMPDGVLLDWNMPVMTGIEFLKALRKEFGPSDISFIQQAIEHGAQEFIMKPFDDEILMGKFEQVGLL